MGHIFAITVLRLSVLAERVNDELVGTALVHCAPTTFRQGCQEWLGRCALNQVPWPRERVGIQPVTNQPGGVPSAGGHHVTLPPVGLAFSDSHNGPNVQRCLLSGPGFRDTAYEMPAFRVPVRFGGQRVHSCQQILNRGP